MFRIAIFLMLTASAAFADTIVGRGRVVDGDTLQIRASTIRLEGIDAPEKKQACTNASGQTFDCGRRSGDVLAALIANVELDCVPSGTDHLGRTLAHCFLPDGTEINAKMAASGYAFAFVEYSDRYVPHETRAKQRRSGLWSGRFSYPWCYRDAEKGKACRSRDAFADQQMLAGPSSVGNGPAQAEYAKPLNFLGLQSEGFDCAPRYCKQMRSCKEAMHHYKVCGDTDLDRDDDGIPCENVCGGR